MLYRRMLALILSCMLIVSCTNSSSSAKGPANENNTTIKNKPPLEASFKNLKLPENFNIRQYEGITLNFIVENNLYANILSHENEEFSRVTGINVKIRAVDFETLTQKVNLDFIAQAGEYQLVYVDPYQTLNRFHDYLEVLNPYINDNNLPRIEGFPDDFFKEQVEVCSYFGEDKNIYSIPFDSTTMILYYRKDIFDKYRNQFYNDMGYDWTPGTSNFTWERYYEVARWINENVPKNEVRYGSGLMAEKHNSIFCEFSNILAAYGGDYFADENVNTLGLDSFEKVSVLDDSFIKALDMYKKLASVSAPQSVSWNWTDLARVFRNGEVAMMFNWDENYTYVEDPVYSKVSGKVGYSILPFGDVRSANIYGGSGIGINKYAEEKEKQAAWLYIVWATSKDMQLKVLKHPEGGSLPTRISPYSDPLIAKQIFSTELAPSGGLRLKHMNAVLNAWKEENLYLRPKISNFYQVEQVLVTNLHNMIKLKLDSKTVAEKINYELKIIKDGEQN